MKIVLNGLRIFVGILFVFSGIIKANDPLGLSFKMQEFFELWNLSQFNGLTLFISITIISFEIIVGVALLLGWRMQIISWLLLLLILFFTFLTGYAFFSDKFKNCGCFGDCLPITPLTSFIKDLLLLVFAIVLFYYRNVTQSYLSKKINLSIIILATLGSLLIQFHMLYHLPMIDCLPFKKGNSIIEKMRIPSNAVPDSIAMTFVYKKNETTVEFSAENFPDDFNDSLYKFITRYDKIIRKGKNSEPPIKGFFLTTPENIDVTNEVLTTENPIAILFAERFEKILPSWFVDFNLTVETLKQQKIKLYIVTTDYKDALQWAENNIEAHATILRCDATAIRTAARSNPTFYILKRGVVEGKWSGNDLQLVNKFILLQLH